MLLGRLADLPSYDVYTLRIFFRRYDIPMTDYTELKLSDRKKEELTQYMRDFTRPLIVHSVPIRLMQTPTTCRMLPLAGI